MLDREKGNILGYLKNLAESHGSRTGVLLEICTYLEMNQRLLGEDSQKLIVATQVNENGSPLGKNMSRLMAQQLATVMKQQLDLRLGEYLLLEKSPQEKNLDLLSAHLGLAELEKMFLGLIVRHHSYMVFQSFLNSISREHLQTIDACAACLAADADELRSCLSPDGLLLTAGLIQPGPRSGTDLDDVFSLNDKVRNALYRNAGGIESLLAMIIGIPLIPTLDWDDFDHLGPVRDKLRNFLDQTLKNRTPGINILLWGAPGTGKTEFCKSLAHQLGVDIYAVGEADVTGNEPNRLERIAALRLTQNLLRVQGRTLTLFDEMDDLLNENVAARLFGVPLTVGSKVFINRLLESNPLPTLWVINDVRSLDRMSLVVEVKTPPADIRTRFLGQVLEKNGVILPTEDVRRMAELNVSPAVVANAAKFAHQVGGSPQDFNLAAEGIVQAMRGGKSLPPVEEEQSFLPVLVNANLDLGELTAQLVRFGSRPFSLCLYGPSGTGKSAYLRHLAEKMGMPVLLKRASDLFGKYVGESEKNIAEAFREAVDGGAFLIFDEADSLLGDRRDASHSWEVSQVNEMLTWMERHPLPFACTTNLMERLDQASLRRFTVKCRFDYLRDDQLVDAARHFFGCDLQPLQLRANLTPGDFAVVQRKSAIFGNTDSSSLAKMLCTEVETRNEGNTRRIGFGMTGDLRSSKSCYPAPVPGLLREAASN